MRSSMLLAVVVCLLMATTGAHAQGKIIDGDLSDWGWNAATKTFNPTGKDIEFCSGWDVTNNHITDELGGGTYSGGEWFDIELLCMDIVYNDQYIQKFNWAMVTSYAGWEPNEWYPNTSWDGISANRGDAVSGRGIYAAERDNYPGSTATNARNFAYPVNPVIGISLDNKPATLGKSKYEYGLIVDPSDTQTLGNIDVANAQLWKVTEGWTNPTGDTWVPGNYYDQEVCFKTDGTTNQQLIANGTSVRRYGYYEAKSTQWEGGSYPWQQYHNWFWEGSIDVSSLGLEVIDVGAESGAHYAMWCGNDHVETTYTPEGGGGPTPELPPGALLLLGMAPLGLRWWKGRRQ